MSRGEQYRQAFAAYRKGDQPDAERRLEALLSQWPEDAQALLLKGVVHTKSEETIGLALVEQSVRLDPFSAEAWYNLGVFEAERDRLDAALTAYERAVLFNPLHVDALGNGCELLRRFDRFEAALDWADRQFALGGGGWPAHLNRAISLFHLRRLDEAQSAFDAALALEPERPIIRWEQFAPLLHQQRFAEAWAAFEYRFACGHLNGVHHYPFSQPLWRGEPLAGRHILVHNEQGLGDQLMFAQALPEVIADAAQVTIVTSPELAALFSASFPTATVVAAVNGRFAGDHPRPPWLETVKDADFQLPIGGLMHRLRTSRASFRGEAAYLRASDAARTRWSAEVTARLSGGGQRVGLCWASNPALFRHDSSRRAVKKSMSLDTLVPLAGVEGVQFISVLNWAVDPQPPGFQGRLVDASADLRSLDDTAALIEQLDLVITVDTAVAHLAGALGRPTWLLLHDFADCRWGLSETDSYWYPHMRLFRQSLPGDWDSVVADVRAALRQVAQP